MVSKDLPSVQVSETEAVVADFSRPFKGNAKTCIRRPNLTVSCLESVSISG